MTRDDNRAKATPGVPEEPMDGGGRDIHAEARVAQQEWLEAANGLFQGVEAVQSPTDREAVRTAVERMVLGMMRYVDARDAVVEARHLEAQFNTFLRSVGEAVAGD